MVSLTVDEERGTPGKATEPEESAQIARASPRQTQERPGPRMTTKKVVLAVLVLVCVTVAIVVPIVHRNNKGSDKEDPAPIEENTSRPEIAPYSAFNASLENFNQDILRGYESEEEFRMAFSDGARIFLDRVVARNIGIPGYENAGRGGSMMLQLDDAEVAFDAAAQPEGAGASKQSDQYDQVNDFGTNNQEEGVEEGDVAVANQEYLFAAYGDYVLVWDTTTGARVVSYKLPEVQGYPDDGLKPPPQVEPGIDEPNETQGQDPAVDPEMGFGEPPSRRRASSWIGQYRPSIQSMMLRGTKLIVIANGYGSSYAYSTEHAIDSYLATRIMIFETEGVGGAEGLVLVKSKDVSGTFVSMRAIGTDVHFVTTANLVLYNRLVEPFEKNSNEDFLQMSESEYVSAVTRMANEKVIPDFVDTFVKDVKIDGVLPSFLRINNWDDGQGASVSPFTLPDAYMSSTVLIYSLPIEDAIQTVGPDLSGFSASGAIVPDYGGATVYAASDIMIIASAGSGFSKKHDAVVSKTNLISFKLSGASAVPYTVGSVFGSILNQYALDAFNGVLRIATTIQTRWMWGILPVFEDTPTADEDTAEEEVGVWEDTESSTENYITTLSIPGQDLDNNETTPLVMNQLDELKIGKPNEVITAVRFYNKYAYVVTFEQRDPFYKLNMTDPEDIQILAEIDITGFSQYLHAIDENKEVILALGQETNEDGWVLGVQISLFDMRDTENVNVVRYNIEVDPETYSSSDALWDKNAVRFNMETGLLIIPMNVYFADGTYFNGFNVFEISETSITPRDACSVDYYLENSKEANTELVERYCGWLSSRAMIFEGSMITMKEHFISRTDLGTCASEWSQDIVFDSGSEGCYWYRT